MFKIIYIQKKVFNFRDISLKEIRLTVFYST